MYGFRTEAPGKTSRKQGTGRAQTNDMVGGRRWLDMASTPLLRYATDWRNRLQPAVLQHRVREGGASRGVCPGGWERKKSNSAAMTEPCASVRPKRRAMGSESISHRNRA